MLIRLLCFLILLSPLHAKEYPYNLSLAAIFQNEATYLKEWIEYYRMLGVERFILYNNESEDNYLEVLQPYIDDGIVELIDWPTTPFINFNYAQIASYRDCVAREVENTKWLIIVDCDEFVVPVNDETIPNFLRRYDKYAGIKINWQLYGTSFMPEIPEGKTMVETLVLKAKDDYFENKFCKLIIRPERIWVMNLHTALPKRGYAIKMPGAKNKDQKLCVKEIRINHYWSRAEDFLFEYKIPRARRIRANSYPPEEMNRILTDFNQVEDRIMDRYVPELRRRLGFE